MINMSKQKYLLPVLSLKVRSQQASVSTVLVLVLVAARTQGQMTLLHSALLSSNTNMLA